MSLQRYHRVVESSRDRRRRSARLGTLSINQFRRGNAVQRTPSLRNALNCSKSQLVSKIRQHIHRFVLFVFAFWYGISWIWSLFTYRREMLSKRRSHLWQHGNMPPRSGQSKHSLQNKHEELAWLERNPFDGWWDNKTTSVLDRTLQQQTSHRLCCT
jgi:hypothetical protein